MSKFIKVADNNYTYINVDYIVRIDYVPIDNRLKEYKDDPADVIMANGEYHKIRNEDAEKLIYSTPNTTE